MPKFDAPAFQIELPPDTVDASSYCFALPASGRFHPSIVIKSDDLPKGEELRKYVEVQVTKLRKQLKNFVLISGPDDRGPGQIGLQCRWGDGDSRFRQTMLFRQKGTRVFNVTGTQLGDGTDEQTKMLAGAIASFNPK
jgi:hypothetical protein